MGNTNSSDLAPNSPSAAASNSHSASTTSSAPPRRAGSTRSTGGGGRVGAREGSSHGRHGHRSSVHEIASAPPKGIAAAVPSLVTAQLAATPSTSVTERHATASVVTTSPQRPRRLHARSRSSTSPLHLSHDLPPLQRADTMGANESKPSSHAGSPSQHQQYRPPSRANTLPVRSTASPAPVEPVSEAPEPEPEKPTPPSDTSQPVSVPPPANHDGQTEKESIAVPPGYSESPYSLAPANYIRPPRLPLPIEEEIHTPGSPIITPQDVENTSALEQVDVEGGAIPRKTSVLSSTTIDDDDVGDNEAFANDAQWGEVRVPTRLEWNGHGDKIFATGTFCDWERKVKLHRNKDRQGFSANVNLRPGTHHIKFLVDGEMTTSNDLPTTVDWSNILVNYIEVVAPLPAPNEDEQQPPAPAEPMPIPGAAITKGQATGTSEPASRPSDEKTETLVPETDADLPSTLQESVGPKNEQPLPTTGQVIASPTPTQKQEVPKQEPKPTPAPPKQRTPRPKYTNDIPQFLIDLDNYHNPEDERFQRAQRVATTLPQPPTLPMFLSKSILNGATPHKDDASVLVMPNHTVLNHLATSSIRHGVLATSGTTRYKRKFLTTIMYKPTSDDG